MKHSVLKYQKQKQTTWPRSYPWGYNSGDMQPHGADTSWRWEWGPIGRLRLCLCSRWERTMKLRPCTWLIAGRNQGFRHYCYSRVEEDGSILLPGLACFRVHTMDCLPRTIFNELNVRIAVSIFWEKKFIVVLNSASRSKYRLWYQSSLFIITPGCPRCLPQTQ